MQTLTKLAKRRVLTTLLGVGIALALVPASAFAQDEGVDNSYQGGFFDGDSIPENWSVVFFVKGDSIVGGTWGWGASCFDGNGPDADVGVDYVVAPTDVDGPPIPIAPDGSFNVEKYSSGLNYTQDSEYTERITISGVINGAHASGSMQYQSTLQRIGSENVRYCVSPSIAWTAVSDDYTDPKCEAAIRRVQVLKGKLRAATSRAKRANLKKKLVKAKQAKQAACQ